MLLDTNVWLDYFIPDRDQSAVATELINLISTKKIPIYCFAGSLKDTFYVAERELKHLRSPCSTTPILDLSKDPNSLAWAFIKQIRNLSTTIPCNEQVIHRAFALRALCEDFEDCLILAAAQEARCSHLVTSDRGLRAISIVPALGVAEALAFFAA